MWLAPPHLHLISANLHSYQYWCRVVWNVLYYLVSVCVCNIADLSRSPGKPSAYMSVGIGHGFFFNSVSCPASVVHTRLCPCGVIPPTAQAKKTALSARIYPPSTPLVTGPSRHISVMALYRSRGLLVHTQCPSIATLQAVSEGYFISCGLLCR